MRYANIFANVVFQLVQIYLALSIEKSVFSKRLYNFEIFISFIHYICIMK